MNETKNDDISLLNSLYRGLYGQPPAETVPLAGAGSNRRYYLLTGNDGHKIIGTIGETRRENEAFISLSRHFRGKGIDFVPEVLSVSADGMAYLQTYAGDVALYDLISGGRTTGEFSPEETVLLKEAIRILPAIQFRGAENLDFSVCYPQASMDERMIRWDLNYFKYCFLKPSGIQFDEIALQDDFDLLEKELLRGMDNCHTFIHRDFQSRNVMANKNRNLSVIDFQGGRRGPVAYDVASFIWQAKANIPATLKKHLVETYLGAAGQYEGFNPGEFIHQLPFCVLFRVLQTLGAYGFLGWVEKKPHFLASIEAGIRNLRDLMSGGDIITGNASVGLKFPTLSALASLLADRYLRPTTMNGKEEGLTVSVGSFSYKKGLPTDDSGNGGGFVFDCRATHNPGRYEPYKKLTGMDAPVISFLEEDGEILTFLDNCYRLVDASVERYLQRGFTHLSVQFGCTGGQHRSVYSAESMARHLNEKYGVRVKLCHREQQVERILEPHPLNTSGK